MRTLLLLLILYLQTEFAYSQAIKEKEFKTEIKEVTVFQNGAQLFEAGKVAIPKGITILKATGLSPYVDEKSIQVKAEGAFTILAVNHKLNYLANLVKDEKMDSLQNLVKTLARSMDQEDARLEVLMEKRSLLNENKNLSGLNTAISIEQLKAALTFYELEISGIKAEELKIQKSKEKSQQQITKLENQIKVLNSERTLPTSEIEIRVQSESTTSAEFKITYIVSNAGWFPKYDIRVKDIESPLKLTYKAEVFQKTGVDWKNVKLRFSNGNPNQSGLMPELKTWNLNYARYTIHDVSSLYGSQAAGFEGTVYGRVLGQDGLPIPGVNVVVKGTSLGTVTDENGKYNLTLPNSASHLVFSFIGMTSQTLPINSNIVNAKMTEDVTRLEEVVTTGYGNALAGSTAGVRIRGLSSFRDKGYSAPIITRVIENQTTVEIEVETPYTLKSNGEKLQVDLKQHAIEALYEYYAIPKLDKDAFLIARIINWDQYNLLEGEANLYFEDAFIGRSVLNAKSLQDTLSISLGRDRNIVVGREKNDQFTRRRTMGVNITETRGFKIIVRNKKSQPIKLTLFDQLPVSVLNDITVSELELSNGLHDEKTGMVTWELKVDPSQQQELKFEYEVKYPKREKVILE